VDIFGPSDFEKKVLESLKDMSTQQKLQGERLARVEWIQNLQGERLARVESIQNLQLESASRAAVAKLRGPEYAERLLVRSVDDLVKRLPLNQLVRVCDNDLRTQQNACEILTQGLIKEDVPFRLLNHIMSTSSGWDPAGRLSASNVKLINQLVGQKDIRGMQLRKLRDACLTKTGGQYVPLTMEEQGEVGSKSCCMYCLLV
jgi:hypothetical protein